jgi:hypothetical protein
VVKSIRYQFTHASIVKGIDIELDTYLAAFAVGKVDWYDEISMSSDLVVVDLIRMGLIEHYGNIISFNTIALMTAYRTLGIIYFSMGTAYLERYKMVVAEYERLLTSSKLTVDTKNTAKVTPDIINRTYKVIKR